MSETRTLPYQPALDGVRAVAVVLVLVFHGGATWLTGGYVGVSVFFTLSGYLITSLLVVEHERTGTVRLGAFYARRMKRLLPASLICLGIVAVAAAAGGFDTFPDLRRDLLAALFQVANWGKLAGDATYADLTNATLGRVAPLEHYWSLAIEEQFYWLWPLVVLGLYRWLRSTRRVSVAVVVLAVLAGIAAPVIAAVWGADAAYWSTPARVGEILVGAVLAVVQHRWGSAGRWSVALAPLGLAIVLWAAVSWPAASGPAYEGWFPAFALASAGLIAGLQAPSPMRTALSWRPMVWIGTVSYGLYLYHWPIYAVVTEDRIGTGGIGLFAVRIAITFAAAAVSARFVERPVRRWSPRWPRPLVSGALATAALSGLVVVAVQPAGATDLGREDASAVTIAPLDGTLAPLSTVAPAATSETIDASATSDAREPGRSDSTPTTAVPVSVPVPVVTRPVRILVVGDSTAQYTAAGLAAWAGDHPDVAQVTDASVAGCGFLRTGRVPTDGDIDWQGQCDELIDGRLPGLLAELQPDVVMLMVTMRDVEDREWAGEGVISPFDERFRSRLLTDYTAMAERLRAAGVPRIAWVLPPNPIAPFQGEQVKMLDPDRYQVQFDVIGEVAASAGDLVRVLDLRAWLQSIGQDRSGEWRPDGLHFDLEAAYEVADRYLVGSLVSTALG